ncbi:alkaline phosphatase family protein [bacterium CPR1]|nr:alkaline phosphatase family protein [bacterium CPR1]
MARPTALLLVVGLTEPLLAAAPRMSALGKARRVTPCLPAVTCPVQATMLTGLSPEDHGIVANGWYDRELCEILFWKQSNRLVQGEKVWEVARRRDPAVTCANLFWWFNMYSSVDVSVTPRPIYKADGTKRPDIYTYPPGLRDELQRELGQFPLHAFWGPLAGLASSRWIARAARRVYERYRPTLSLVYLPHLDYALQRTGDLQPALSEIDTVVGELSAFYASQGVRVLLVSEYGIEPVQRSVPLNLLLRRSGWLTVRNELGHELLDAGASRAFAVCDHQVAQVYVRDGVNEVRARLEQTEGVERVQSGGSNPRSGELVVVAAPGYWFSYRYWEEERRAPDFARTVEIHRKPGFDPLELHFEPALRFPRLTLARKMLARKLGLRNLLDVVALDESLVRGSHGRPPAPAYAPVLITPEGGPPLEARGVFQVLLDSLFPA